MQSLMTSSRVERENLAAALRERQIRQEATELQGSLIRFLEGAWPEIDPAPFQGNWHLDAVAEHLEQVAYGNIRKLLINLPPRFTKSLLVSVAFPAWVWAQIADPEFPIMGPQAKFLCLSYSTDLVFDMAVKMNRLVKSTWYQERWGRRVILQPDADSKSLFENTAGGSRISTSIGGTVTGRGGDYKIIDDPHNVKKVESQTMREAVLNDYDQVLKNRVTDPRVAAEIIVMQRTHEGDLSGHILATDEDFVHLCLPAEFEPSRHCWTHINGQAFWADPRTKPGELLWAERWNAEQLAPFKKNPYTWAGQYQQRPAPKGGGVIKREWWQLWGDEDDPELEKAENAKFRKHPTYTYLIGVLDTAYTEKQENDPSAMAVWGVFNDDRGMPQVMLAYAWKERMIFPDLLKRVLVTGRRYKIDTLLIEDKTAGPPIAQQIQTKFIRESWTTQLLPINRSSGDKTARITNEQPAFVSGQVWAPNKVWANDFIDEVTVFPKGLHDECVDLTSMGLRWLRQNGLLDTEEEVRAKEESARRERPGKQKPLYPGAM